MVCARQIIEEMPNDLVRRNPAKYTSQYINRLMSMIPNWKRSDQEKSKGCILPIVTRPDEQSIRG